MIPLQQSMPLFQDFNNLNLETYEQQLRTAVQPSLTESYIEAIASPDAHILNDVSLNDSHNKEVNKIDLSSCQNTHNLPFDTQGEPNNNFQVPSTLKIEVTLPEQLNKLNHSQNDYFCLKSQEDVELNYFVSQGSIVSQLDKELNHCLKLENYSSFDKQISLLKGRIIGRKQRLKAKLLKKQLQQAKKTKNQKRNDDSNNAHKKMITCLNKATKLVSNKNLYKIKATILNQQQEVLLRTAKSSRYGFICKLIHFQHLYGPLYLEQLFIIFCKQVIPEFIIQNKKMPDSESREYLLRLPEFYMRSFDTFLKGNIQQATELIYKMDMIEKFKQKLYMQKGIQRVVEIRKELLSLN